LYVIEGVGGGELTDVRLPLPFLTVRNRPIRPVITAIVSYLMSSKLPPALVRHYRD